MQDFNNIDDLFRKKLANREVAYSASSWAGAEQLLNKHYKWLFLKKLLFTLLPATIVSAAGVIYLMNSEPATLQTLNEKTVPVQIEATATEPIKERDRALAAPSPVTKSQGNIDEMYLRESRNTRPVAVSQEAVAAKDVPGPEPVSASVAARLTANARSTRSLNNSPASTDAGQPAVAATPSTNHKVPIAEDLGALLDEVFAPGSRPGSAALVVPGNDHTAASATMDGMPKFTISKIGSGNGSALADADRKAGEPLMNKLHKLDLALDGGGLIARGFLNAAARRERVSAGCYAALTAEYHVNQNLFVSSGAGLFSRGGTFLQGLPRW